MNSSALIGGKFNVEKNPLQDLLSSVNAVTSTNERIEFITGHMTRLILKSYRRQPPISYSEKFSLQK